MPENLTNEKLVFFSYNFVPSVNKPLAEPMLTQLYDAMFCLQWPLLLTWFNLNPSMDK